MSGTAQDHVCWNISKAHRAGTFVDNEGPVRVLAISGKSSARRPDVRGGNPISSRAAPERRGPESSPECPGVLKNAFDWASITLSLGGQNAACGRHRCGRRDCNRAEV